MQRYLYFVLNVLLLIYIVLFCLNIYFNYSYENFIYVAFRNTVTFTYTLNENLGILIFLMITVLNLFLSPFAQKLLSNSNERSSIQNNVSLLDSLVSFYKFCIVIISILSVIAIFSGIILYLARLERENGLILIASGIVILAILGPSALLLVIKEDLREIKKRLEK